jgi:hypothetical protein
MGTPAEWIHVLVSGCVWAFMFGVLLFSFHAESSRLRTQRRRGGRIWFWFGASLVFAGLSFGMMQAFGWRLLHGWLLFTFTTSLLGMCASGAFYRRISRSSDASRGPDPDGDNAAAAVHDRAGILRYAIEKAINQTGYQKLRNQKRASYIKLAAMLFSSAATVLLGLKGVGSEQVFKNIAFVFSASVTLLTALEPFFNFRSFWVEHEIAQGRFLGLRADLDFYLAGSDAKHPDETKLAGFHQAYQKIWDDLNTVWAENRRREKT